MDFAAYLGEFQRFPRLGLERMSALARLLGDPQDGLRVVHVAGTNGKGSLCAYLDAVLGEAGYRVGKFVSPELLRVNERITVSGREIGTEELNALAEKIAPAADAVRLKLGEAPSRFEVSAAAALLHFQASGCDVVLLETGLGGRLDATNICKKPLLTVIMPVAPDHQEHLGHSIKQIAAEKAGIIKDGVPVVCAPQPREALEVVEAVCEEKRCRLTLTDEKAIRSRGYEGFNERFEYRNWKGVLAGLSGWHQAVNAAAALDALEVLRRDSGIPVPDGAVVRGIGKARHRGRMEVFRKDPLLLFDGAHNVQCAKALAYSLARYCPGRKMTVVMALMRDKDAIGMVGALRDVARRFVALSVPGNPRAMEAEELLSHMLGAGCEAVSAETVEEGMALTGGSDTVVCGSLYLYAAFKRWADGALS